MQDSESTHWDIRYQISPSKLSKLWTIFLLLCLFKWHWTHGRGNAERDKHVQSNPWLGLRFSTIFPLYGYECGYRYTYRVSNLLSSMVLPLAGRGWGCHLFWIMVWTPELCSGLDRTLWAPSPVSCSSGSWHLGTAELHVTVSQALCWISVLFWLC